MVALQLNFTWPVEAKVESLRRLVERASERTGVGVADLTLPTWADHDGTPYVAIHVRFTDPDLIHDYDLSITGDTLAILRTGDGGHPYAWHHLVGAATDLGAVPRFEPHPAPERDGPWSAQPRWFRFRHGRRLAKAAFVAMRLTSPIWFPVFVIASWWAERNNAPAQR